MEYIILLISLVGIVLGADFLVAGAVSIARKFKVSDFVIGAAIVGVGTSMPELVVSFIGALKGNADVAIGNVVGSNIFNVLGILGVTALFFPIAINNRCFGNSNAFRIQFLQWHYGLYWQTRWFGASYYVCYVYVVFFLS